MPDGTYALYDSRLKLHGNTLDEPTPDGGGHTVLRSTLRYQRDGLMTMRYPWAEEVSAIMNIRRGLEQSANHVLCLSCAVLCVQRSKCCVMRKRATQFPERRSLCRQLR